MIVVHDVNDVLKIDICGIIFHVSPLTQRQKMDVMNSWSTKSGEATNNSLAAVEKLMRYMIRDVEGLSTSNGSSYRLEKEDGKLTDRCIDNLLNLPISTKLTVALQNFITSIPEKEFIDFQTGKKLEDVKFVSKEDPISKK